METALERPLGDVGEGSDEGEGEGEEGDPDDERRSRVQLDEFVQCVRLLRDNWRITVIRCTGEGEEGHTTEDTDENGSSTDHNCTLTLKISACVPASRSQLPTDDQICRKLVAQDDPCEERIISVVLR